MNTIDLQPQYETPRTRVILYMDLAGRGTGEIAEALGITACRVSIIKGSPMYARIKEEETAALREKFMDKQATALTTDPVKEKFKAAAAGMARNLLDIANNGQSEFVKLNATKDVLDRAGYMVERQKIAVPSIQVEAKVVAQFQEILDRSNPAQKSPPRNLKEAMEDE